MMGILRAVVSLIAIIFVFTLAFGEEIPAYDADLPLSISRLEDSVSQVESTVGRMPLGDDADYPISSDASPFGENGELPSEINQQYSAQPIPQNTSVEEDLYNLPTKGLGYLPGQEDTPLTPEEMQIKGTQISVENMKRTGDIEAFQKPQGGDLIGSIITSDDATESNDVPEWFPSINEQSLENLSADVSAQLTKVQSKTDEAVKFQTDKKRSVKEIAAYGLLTATTGGFDTGVWDGVTRAKADHFLKKLRTVSLKSPRYINLVKRLLLTQATPPKGVSEENWLVSRVKALHHFGEVDTATMLLLGSGVHLLPLEKHPDFAKVWAENLFMNGKFDQACTLARDYSLKDSKNTFWGDSLNLCLYAQENFEGLTLRLGLISESQKASNKSFYMLLDKGLKEERDEETFILPVAPDSILPPMVSTLVARIEAALQPNIVLLLPDVLLRQVAMDTTLTMTVRIQAAEQLVNRYQHTEDVALLSLLYDKVKFEEDIVSSPLVGRYAEEEVDGSKARALLWQAAQRSGLPSTRAMNLVSLWQRAVQDNLFSLGGQLTPNLRNVAVSDNVMWFAPRVVRHALYNNRLDIVRNWWEPFEKSDNLAREVLAERHELSVMRAIETGKLEPHALSAWWRSLGLDSAKERVQVEKILSILEASEINVPVELWQQLQLAVDDAYVMHEKGPGGMWLRVLGTALEEGHVAEALMVIGQPLRYAAMGEFSAQTQRNIVTALRFLGLDDDANAMAFEALIDLDVYEPESY